MQLPLYRLYMEESFCCPYKKCRNYSVKIGYQSIDDYNFRHKEGVFTLNVKNLFWNVTFLPKFTYLIGVISSLPVQIWAIKWSVVLFFCPRCNHFSKLQITFLKTIYEPSRGIPYEKMQSFSRSKATRWYDLPQNMFKIIWTLPLIWRQKGFSCIIRVWKGHVIANAM